ncbi:hypothetical protein COY95_00930 [Candidatus Woesearchaeota archaeon CG_4_10_14_0_8_um_filter_47_5]|nr:MAG: hypothetical protein COY95_00930 [Candidatus Woesearchaeota archaeon CG_4_10_14_0_8_um_filter_47_5]
MKDITPRLIALLRDGYCAPQIARIAKKLKEPASTIHYNLKKLEKEGALKSCKAVFNYKKIGEGYCTYLLIRLSPEFYDKAEEVAAHLVRREQVESADIVTGNYELLIKLRCRDSDEYYALVQDIIKCHRLAKVMSMTSLKQFKTEFVAV